MRDHFGLRRELSHHPGLVNVLRERLLTIDIDAVLHGPNADVGMEMVGGCDHHPVQFFGFDHLPEIRVFLRLRVVCANLVQDFRIHIA